MGRRPAVQASATGGPVAAVAGRAPSLQFTVWLQGARQASFDDARWQASWRAGLMAALPGKSTRTGCRGLPCARQRCRRGVAAGQGAQPVRRPALFCANAGLTERGIALAVTQVNLLPVNGYSTDSTDPLTSHRAINVTQGHVQASLGAGRHMCMPHQMRARCTAEPLLPSQLLLQVVGPPKPALLQLAAKLLAGPGAVWQADGLDVAPFSVWLAYTAPVSRPPPHSAQRGGRPTCMQRPNLPALC